MSKKELGINYFTSGYNCAQAVTLAFQEELGLEKEFIAKAVSGFGGGFGRMREVCGAVSGMVFVISCLEGNDNPSDNTAKMETYKKIQHLMNLFKEKNGSYVCRELLSLPEHNSCPVPEERTETYYKKRPCALLVGDACELLENFLKR